MTRRLRYVWLIPVYLLLLLILTELLLQLGSAVVGGQARLVQAQWLTGHTRILALGDSNTYGLYLDAAQAWPAQLEQQWNVANPAYPVEVLNLGYPGTNSFRVRDNLPALLDKLSPDIVLLMVGFNDFWTPVESVDTSKSSSALSWLKDHSRVYRFYSIWSRSHISQQDMHFGSPRDVTAVDLENIETHLLKMNGDAFYMGTLKGDPARDRHALGDNLSAMIDMVYKHDAKIYLLTYPSNWGFYPGANNWIKIVAEKQQVPLIDITPIFIGQCSEGPISCPDLLFRDSHATARGNAQVAESIEHALKQVLQH